MTGVDGHRFAVTERDRVEGAVARQQHRAVAGGVDEEAAFTAEQVLEPAPLGVESTPTDDANQQPLVIDIGSSALTPAVMMSPARWCATSTQPPASGAVYVVMNRLSPPRNERLRPFITPPWVLALTSTPAEVAIIVPDSPRNCSPGSSPTRATANDGLWRTSTFTPSTVRVLTTRAPQVMSARPMSTRLHDSAAPPDR